VEASGWREWPPRLPGQPIFYPVLNEDYATKIARDWNVKHSGSGYVTRFRVRRSFLNRYLVATGLGLVAIAGSVALVVADGVGGGIRWAHHSGVSAAPLLLVAGCHRGGERRSPGPGASRADSACRGAGIHGVGLAQLFPDSAAAGVLNDPAILLFVVDAGCAVITEAGVLPRRRVPGTSSSAAGEHGRQISRSGH
jgi:hypothetical protein